jgi:RNA polymerase sigma factor (sigma-70 family)
MVGFFVNNVRSIDLAELVRRAQNNPSDDTAEMNEIIRRFDRLALKIAKRLTPDWMLQDDLANASRYSLVKAVRKFNGKAAFPGYARAYMIGAAKRELTQWKRSAAPEGSVPLHEVEDGEEAVMDKAMFKVATDAPEPLDRTWGSARLTELVTSLSKPQRVVMDLAYMEDMSLSQIAAQENVTVAAISQRKTHALQAIERQWVAA